MKTPTTYFLLLIALLPLRNTESAPTEDAIQSTPITTKEGHQSADKLRLGDAQEVTERGLFREMTNPLAFRVLRKGHDTRDLYVSILISESEDNRHLVGFALTSDDIRRRYWRFVFRLGDKGGLDSFKESLTKFIKWSDIAKREGITNYRKEIGTLILATGEERPVVFVTRSDGSPAYEFVDGFESSLSPEVADHLLFALSSVDQAIKLYGEQRNGQRARSQQKDSLFQ